ncbi:phage minor head protein, partial [Salmonella enterica subsp. enterica serovar Paratyphi A]
MSSLQSRKRAPRSKTEKVLRPVRPNVGIAEAYRKKLDRLVEAMHVSVMYWVKASYRANEPRVAMDETPADVLRRTMKQLSAQWLKKFDTAAENLAAYFAQSVEKRSTAALKKILRDGGMSVEFKMTPVMRDVVDATVHQNVALIKSIPAQYLDQVEGMVMRSVQTGRDLGQLASDLETRLGVTKRRAAFISLDQNNKATAAFNRVRLQEVGIDEAIWTHSGAAREPRHTHLKAGREKTRYQVSKGWYDPA